MSGDGLVNPMNRDDDDDKLTGAPRLLTVKSRRESYIESGECTAERKPFIY